MLSVWLINIGSSRNFLRKTEAQSACRSKTANDPKFGS